MSHPSCVHVQFKSGLLAGEDSEENGLKIKKNQKMDPNGQFVGTFTFRSFSDKVLPDCVTVVPGEDPKIFRVKLPTAAPLNLVVVRASTQRCWKHETL